MDDDRRLRQATRWGLGFGLVVFTWVLLAGRAEVLPWAPAGDFYDAQAHALLDGHLDIDPEVLSIEAFFHDGRAYMYQPPFPALLRLPVAALTDRFDGRLGAVSMLLAAGVLVVALDVLFAGLRRVLRPPADGPAVLLSGLLGFVAIAGAAPVFLASRPWVYHESALWGLAWTMAAFALLVRLLERPSWWGAALLLGATASAVLSRISVGLGAVAAVAVAAALQLRRSPGDDRERSGRGQPSSALVLAGVAVLPVVAYMAVNLAKFGTLTSVPFDQQGHTRVDPARQAMLEANDGTLFGLRFVPTTLNRYLRPDGIDLTSRLPFVDFREPGAPTVGGVQFDAIDWSASIPASLPGLALGAVLGAAVLWRIRRRPEAVERLLPLVAGGAAAAATILPFGYVAHRYLADVNPLLVTGSAVGAYGLLSAATTARVRRAAAALAAVLVAYGVWVNGALAVTYQRLRAPNPRPELVAELVRAQVGSPVGRAPRARPVPALPEAGAHGELVAVDGCAALYAWSRGWVAVERTEAAGAAVVELDIPSLPEGERFPILTTDGPDAPVLWVERLGSRVRGGLDDAAAPRTQPIGGRKRLHAVLDPHLGVAVLWLGDQPLTSGSIEASGRTAELVVGRATDRPGIEAATPGIELVAGAEGDLCRRLGGDR